MTSRLPIGQTFDPNPFKPTVPDGLDISTGLYAYLRSLAESLREQHNNTQVGSSTFPWQMLNALSAKALYPIGCLGKFLHPEYGIIRARYCQYRSPKATLWTGAPVGFVAGANGFKWEVTNSFILSLSYKAVGLQGAWTTPRDGDYGWIIVDGINTQSLLVESSSVPAPGEGVAWLDSGTAHVGVVDMFAMIMSSTGLVMVDSNHWEIAPGSLYVSDGLRWMV